jgi:hypothetical protein
MLRNRKVHHDSGVSRYQGCFLRTNGHGWKRAVTVCAQMREIGSVPIPLLQLSSEYDLA